MQKTTEYKKATYNYVLENGNEIPILNTLQTEEMPEEIVLQISFVDMYFYRVNGIKNYYFCQN